MIDGRSMELAVARIDNGPMREALLVGGGSLLRRLRMRSGFTGISIRTPDGGEVRRVAAYATVVYPAEKFAALEGHWGEVQRQVEAPVLMACTMLGDLWSKALRGMQFCQNERGVVAEHHFDYATIEVRASFHGIGVVSFEKDDRWADPMTSWEFWHLGDFPHLATEPGIRMATADGFEVRIRTYGNVAPAGSRLLSDHVTFPR
jgi:hypothetical protein